MPAGAMHPDVARVKFDREVANLARQNEAFRRRGAFLLQVDYPRVVVLFAPPKLKPAPLIFAMLADYTDYDLQPPSVQFVDPFTYEPLTAAQLPTKMMRSIPHPPVQLNVPNLPAGAVGVPDNSQLEMPANSPGVMGFPWMPVVEQQALLQDYGPDTIPFLCIAGVREYHQHPGHSGDPWELHRLTGAGALVRLVEIVLTYAVQPAVGWAVNMVPQIAIGYSPEPPE
jgi:hypothetical protein